MSFLKRDGTITLNPVNQRKLPVTAATSTHPRPTTRYRRRRAPPRTPPANRYVDMPLTAIAVWAAGEVTLLGPFPQGTGENARIGKVAALRSLRLLGRWDAPLAFQTVSVCLMLVYDRKPGPTIPAFQDIFAKETYLSGHTGLWVQELEQVQDRFLHVARWNFQLIGRTALDVTKGSFRLFDEYVDLQHLPMIFADLGHGGLSDIQKGALYMCTVSAAPDTNFVLFEYAMRIKFDSIQ